MSEISSIDDLEPQYSTDTFNTDPSHFLEPIEIAIETIRDLGDLQPWWLILDDQGQLIT